VKRILTILSALVITSCGGGSSTPTSPTPTATPTPSVFALSGSVRDAQGSAALSGVNVQILDGPAGNRSTASDASGNYSFTGLTPAGFSVRFSRSGYNAVERGVNLTADTRVDVTMTAIPSVSAAPSAPSAPSGLSASVSGNTATLRWSAVSGATDYVVRIGTSQGNSNVRTTDTSGTSYVWSDASSGTYFARVQARNSAGVSDSSNEVQFAVASSGGGGGGGSSTPPSSWSGSLPSTSGGSHPVCQAPLPATASCVNNLVGPPQAICDDRAFSCSTGSGTCSSHGGVYCWRQ
jgi:hypothetical protein